LPETLRTSNRDQAAHFVDKLNVVDCAAVRYSGNEPPPFVFTPAEVEVLARLEHDRWCAERTRQGWKLGSDRDPIAKTTPYLVDWEELAENIRDLDRDAVREMPARLAQSGLAIVRLDTPAKV
ncbi:MAG TPA: RyR domain-containing protein, partial [Acidimicrobiia bacterium]|nr:RyR domain-containing protein [Acidimicrobiia bacterium]